MTDHPTPSLPEAVRRRRILAIDGGGLRCLMAIEILVALEERLIAATGRPGFRLCEHFDLVAGTSGGAMIASAVALGSSMVEVRDFVIANVPNMFMPASFYERAHFDYDESRLEGNLRQWFGDETTLGSDRLKTLVLLVMRNASTDSTWLVSNNPHAKYNDRALDDCNLELPLWQLARASAAAPTYYPAETVRFGKQSPYDFVFLDGGMTAYNNPAFKSFLYVTTGAYGLNWPTGEDAMSVLSLGSGEGRRRKPGLRASSLHKWYHLQSAGNVLLSATDREQDLLCRTFGRCVIGPPIDLELGDLTVGSTAVEPRMFRYYRLNPVLTEAGLATLGCGDINVRRVRKLDAIDQVESYLRIGRALADRLLPVYLSDQPPDFAPEAGAASSGSNS